MNVSYRWLRELAPGIREDPETLAERLGMLGAPVEEIGHPGAGLEDIVVARVVRSGPHPDADRLSLCQVDAGDGHPLQVVCGAPNVEEGALYPFAPVGATLPGGLRIRKAKIRGEYSEGMLCSEKELGIGRDQSGILRLTDGLPVGASFVDALELDDTRLTIEVTPNRPDLLSHVGVARELAPEGHHGIELPPFPAAGSDERTDAIVPPLELIRAEREGSVGGVRVRIDDPEGCPRYVAAVIEDVEVGPSPAWLAARLRAIGQRPINNVVDATNYILHELGQPLHAFDLDRLGGGVVIRRAAPGETLTTLDDVDRKLEPHMLVIADAEKPVAVAGVMGGADSEVTEETTRVLLECAHFDPRTVRATARGLGLSTDASYRFERGTDIEGVEHAAHRAVELIHAVAGGRVHEEAVDVYPAPMERPVVALRPTRVTRLLGAEIPADEIVSLLTTLGFELEGRDDDALRFAIPGFRRHDVTREVDLIEEVARRYGYDRFGEELASYRPTTVPEAPLSALEDRLRDFCVGRGLLEARSVPMVPEDAGEVALLRPLSAEEGFLRATLLHGLLRAVELNMARGVRDVRLFELGTTFHAPCSGSGGEEEGDGEAGLPREATRIAAVVTGHRHPRHWSAEPDDWDIWDMKALAGELAGALAPDARVVPLEDGDAPDDPLARLLRDGRRLAIMAGDAVVGVAGEVDPGVVDVPAWAGAVLALEVRLGRGMARQRRPTVVPVPTQPASDRDLALLLPEVVPVGAVADTIRDAAGDLLERLAVFDVYTGKGVAPGTRSVAFRLVFRHGERTLKDEEVDRAVDRVLSRVKDAHGVERRG
jgi:phenylalanyl-tRNA synthetase beta chain